MRRKIKFIVKTIIISILSVIIIVVLLNQIINWRSAKYIFDNIAELPENNVALV